MRSLPIDVGCRQAFAQPTLHSGTVLEVASAIAALPASSAPILAVANCRVHFASRWNLQLDAIARANSSGRYISTGDEEEGDDDDAEEEEEEVDEEEEEEEGDGEAGDQEAPVNGELKPPQSISAGLAAALRLRAAADRWPLERRRN